jgi:hypothetical protein
MAQNFLSCDREQAMLLPASVAEWLPEGHLARFVVEVVERLDLSAFLGPIAPMAAAGRRTIRR